MVLSSCGPVYSFCFSYGRLSGPFIDLTGFLHTSSLFALAWRKSFFAFPVCGYAYFSPAVLSIILATGCALVRSVPDWRKACERDALSLSILTPPCRDLQLVIFGHRLMHVTCSFSSRLALRPFALVGCFYFSYRFLFTFFAVAFCLALAPVFCPLFCFLWFD